MIEVQTNLAATLAEAAKWNKFTRARFEWTLKQVAEEMVEFGTLAQDEEIRKKKLVSTGKLVNSIGGRTIKRGTSWGGQVWNTAVHAPVMDQGRRAGAQMPPLAPIARWVKRKGIAKAVKGSRRGKRKPVPATVVAKRIAFVIARSIARKGIIGRKFMVATEARMVAQLPRIADKWLGMFAAKAGK